MKTFKYITEEARDTVGMTNKEKAQFHYFNPNGLYQEKKKLDEKITKLVDEGKVPNGWIFAFGSMDSFQTDSLSKLAMKKRVGTIEVGVAIKMLRERNENVKKKIEESDKTNRKAQVCGNCEYKDGCDEELCQKQ